MDIILFSTFLAVSVALIVIPGPNILVIVSTSIVHGRTRGLQTVAGTSLAMAIQLLIAALGTAGLVRLLAEGFSILKWIGVTYLAYLGLIHVKRMFDTHSAQQPISAGATFSRGFFVSLTNPKTIVFFAAFLPQFVSTNTNYLQQIGILSSTFLFLAVILDSVYALLAAKLQPLLEQRKLLKLQHGLSATLYLGASAWLAVSRRIQ